MDDSLGAADVGQELVAQTFAVAGALDQTGDVHELDDSGGGLLGVIQVAQPVQTGVGDGDRAYVGLDGAEGVVGAFGACVGNGVEQGAFAHVGHTHDT